MGIEQETLVAYLVDRTELTGQQIRSVLNALALKMKEHFAGSGVFEMQDVGSLALAMAEDYAGAVTGTDEIEKVRLPGITNHAPIPGHKVTRATGIPAAVAFIVPHPIEQILVSIEDKDDARSKAKEL
jgi:hypothetical protein